MSKDLFKSLVSQPAVKTRHVGPEDVFRSLKIRSSSSIKELWAPQADALREWHATRASEDVVFRLNTGAGKTLIGLVAAQSLVNETRGKVVYCCTTNQLVEQTRAKAADLGIETAAYYLGAWHDQDVFLRAEGPALTNYAALFNGKSIFARENLAAVIFDDAHTAHDAVRGAFTLSVTRDEFPDFYSEFAASVAEYFKLVRRGLEFEGIVEGRDRTTVLMIPMFEVIRHAGQWTRALLRDGVEEKLATKFVWAHLASHLGRASVMLDAGRVEFTPLLPPVHSLRVFRAGVRRLYLSATMRANDEFIRTFGKAPSPSINPGGRAGDTERLFLIAPAEMPDDAARGWADDATAGRKAVIMVPSRSAADRWAGSATIFKSEDGHDRIRAFAESADQRLVFVARYDGIDLPGDDCRVMIVDGLPAGMSHMDRFFEVHLERQGVSDGKIASRFVQLLGRTSRGMTDYGVVVLVGRRLREWVLPPVRRALLPEHIQKQLSVGERLEDTARRSAEDLVGQCLNQTKEWAAAYEAAMATAVVEASNQERAGKAEALAWAERRAAEALWDGDPTTAVTSMSGVLTDAYAIERAVGAWYEHWLAFAAQEAGDPGEAQRHYQAAARAKPELGALPDARHSASATDEKSSSPQSAAMAGLLAKRGVERIEGELTADASCLRDQNVSANQHEAAICRIGEYLGLNPLRADKATSGKAHDCIWEQVSPARVLCFDAKTKKTSAHYTKDEIGESAQHALWAEEKYKGAERLLYIVGPRVPATPQATPPRGLRVVLPEALARIAELLFTVFRRAGERNLPLFFAAEIELGLEDIGAKWDVLPESLEAVRLDSLSD